MKNEIVNYSATALSWWLMAIQIDDVIRYINLGLSIFLTCLSIGVSIYNIVKGVRETGKIDKKIQKITIYQRRNLYRNRYQSRRI